MIDADRRTLLGLGAAAGLSGLAAADVFAQSATRGDAPTEGAPARPAPEATYRVPFAVIGLDHNHIYSITDAMIRGGGVLTAFYASDPGQIAAFRKRYGDVKLARSEDEIIDDRKIKLVCSAAIPALRAPLGIKVMRAGKDYLSDKAAVVTLQQLAEVRQAITETGRKFGILYSERLEVPAAVMAGQLVHEGAIGRVIQTINLAPHRLSAPSRPEWFWDTKRNGGILTDVGSHQADQFVYLTGSTRAEVVASQVGNFGNPQHPDFQDFGDMMVHGDGGAGYVRVDWFTPDGLPTWGDGRLFILGTEGYIELRKYVDLVGRPGGNHLFIADRKGARYLDCSKVPLPFGPQFIADIVEHTSIAQDQEGALLAAELVLTATASAKRATTG
ncbi:Gfo/Idh/MocA family oxidoreductase [Sphingomonas sp. BIUV-7]|uniref:Gfo/Idh/MocA family oxidoreductase n=1 Tax=Sphingomonas natans TaxID=3063330 RepID=A0ABT8Y743_9SPHN|nr:Gfo/Idh/MocA family oxidoreductase [Sphingomonas sp. BIUV-7]MDO6414140.1 Gfo/Idh/MocA family oxidoreductase [Sphingomonas sp. BIUV-7]